MTARILVVDDIPTNVKLLEIKLKAEYFQVLTAGDGPTALEIAETEAPDVILTDVMMPGMTGFEVCERLKSNPKTRHIPVVMVTALSDANDRVRGLEAGADDFLTKPCNDLALFARVRSLARFKMMMDELRVRQAASGDEGLFGDDALDGGDDTAGARVLIADSSELNAERIATGLKEVGIESVTESTMDGAISRSRSEEFDLLIVSLYMEQDDGLRLCSQLRSNEACRHIPILLTLDEEDLARLAKGLDLGVTDYLINPVDQNELLARCRTQIRRRRYHDKLRSILQQSVSLAYRDSLTGIYNRRFMNSHLDRKLMEIAETTKPVSVLLLDIDHFKKINDTYGHAAGDEILVTFAKRICGALRDFDMVARFGGEEFVVVMPDAHPEIGVAVGERLRKAIGEEPFTISNCEAPIPVTVSVGAATASDPLETAEELMARADTGLYQAKAEGRDQVCSGPRASEVARTAGAAG